MPSRAQPYGYTRVLGYHPLLATRADTGEVLHARMRTGRANTARGAEGLVEELAGRVRRAGASGPLTLRADSGFRSAKVLEACHRHRIRFSVTVRQTKQVQQAISTIKETAWTPIDYPTAVSLRSPRLSLAATGWWCDHPTDRRASHAVARQALPRLCHRPSGNLGSAGCRPPPCGDGAGHPRPQAGRRAAAPPLGQVPGQRRMAGHPHPGPQPAGLGRRPRLGHHGWWPKTLWCRLIALPAG
jgi:Transposase DDE domain group 1